MNKKGIGGHQSVTSKTNEWLTPPEIIKSLGDFDLDPCSPIGRPWPTAKKHYTKDMDGLSLPWAGRVWCNPPYGREVGNWLSKCADHGDAIALVFARTETKDWVDYIWNRANAIYFIFGRLHFYSVDGERATGNAGGPSALVAYGKNNIDTLKNCCYPGYLVALEGRREAGEGQTCEVK